jgi:hypothetical protein
MTRDEMMRLLQECGFGTLLDHPIMTENMMRFGLLVVAAEREACVKVVELVAREIDDTNGTATYIAKAIRARGESK